MFVASWRRALRTSMGRLRFAESDGAVARDEGLHALFGVMEGGADTRACGAADDVVAIEGGFEGDGREEVRVEFGAELAELVERKVAELAALVEAEAHSVADFLVGFAEGHAFVDEIRGGRHGVEESGCAGGAHAIGTETEG